MSKLVDIKEINGAKYYFAADVNAAIEVGEYLKKNNTYDYFRGQGLPDWKVTTSLARRGCAYSESDDYKLLLNSFGSSFLTDENTKYLYDDIDSFFAVLQHYGIPTNYIDLTTSPKVAAFFAIDGRPFMPDDELQLASIVLINEKDFNKFIDLDIELKIIPALNPPRIVKIDVSNLWRLQAQEGLFLFVPLFSHTNDKNRLSTIEEFIYNFDRIIFPVFGNENIIDKKLIYPERKSSLELIIDQAFYNYSARSFIDKIKNDQTHVIVETKPSRDSTKVFIEGTLPHSSWRSKYSSAWEIEINEKWGDICTDIIIEIELDFAVDKEKFEFYIFKQIDNFFSSESFSRQKDFTFNTIFKNWIHEKDISSQISLSLNRLWSGMRRYPYTLKDIIISITNFLSIIYVEYKKWESENIQKQTSIKGQWESLFELPFQIGIAGYDDSESRAIIDESRFLNCFRSDIVDVLNAESRYSFVNKIWFHLFIHGIDLRYFFDFEALVQLFVDQIIPSQLYLRDHKFYKFNHLHEPKQLPIFFSPLEIKILGPE